VEDTPSLVAAIAKEQNPRNSATLKLPSIMNQKLNRTYQIKASNKMNKTFDYDSPARLGTIDTVHHTAYLEPPGRLLAKPLSGDVRYRPSENFGGPIEAPPPSANFGGLHSGKYKKTQRKIASNWDALYMPSGQEQMEASPKKEVHNGGFTGSKPIRSKKVILTGKEHFYDVLEQKTKSHTHKRGSTVDCSYKVYDAVKYHKYYKGTIMANTLNMFNAVGLKDEF
jgi:hypothetical protein